MVSVFIVVNNICMCAERVDTSIIIYWRYGILGQGRVVTVRVELDR